MQQIIVIKLVRYVGNLFFKLSTYPHALNNSFTILKILKLLLRRGRTDLPFLIQSVRLRRTDWSFIYTPWAHRFPLVDQFCG
jgi:hypothetical protein